MIFDNWEQHSKDAEISKTLLWEYDLSNFDWSNMRTVVMQRVIERGWIEDFYAAIKKYGGLNNVREIIKEIPSLSPIDIAFVCVVFELEKKELRCYTRKRLQEKLLNS
ncbi:hypothetical protein EZS27_001559 [termite gut metagenome]|uniref:DUF6922 domain-containing protein n=1 Tax=termite gut metagenome TaxID=433724 RepID=A0A5J4T0F9_9ZZZZ